MMTTPSDLCPILTELTVRVVRLDPNKLVLRAGMVGEELGGLEGITTSQQRHALSALPNRGLVNLLTNKIVVLRV